MADQKPPVAVAPVKSNHIVEMAVLRKGTNPQSGEIEDIYRHTTKDNKEFWYPHQLPGGTVVKLQFNVAGTILPKTATQPERKVEKDSFSLAGVIGDINAVKNLTAVGAALANYEALDAQP